MTPFNKIEVLAKFVWLLPGDLPDEEVHQIVMGALKNACYPQPGHKEQSPQGFTIREIKVLERTIVQGSTIERVP